MQKLVDGVHRFQQDVFSCQEGFYQRLADGQKPIALFITCSDSRIDPNMLTQTGPGDLFIMRNAGNIVPPYSTTSSGESATIEYAIGLLGIEDIIICGHSHCGAMAALLAPEQTEKFPAVRSWLRHADATTRIMEENYSHIVDPCKQVSAAIQENVLVQLENLRTHPTVLAALGRRQLKLHGWVYKFETGEVFAYNPHTGQFESVDQTGFQSHALTAELRAIS